MWELLSVLPLVSKVWKKVIQCNETWGRRIESRFPTVQLNYKTCLRETYMKLEADEKKSLTIVEGTTLTRYLLPSLKTTRSELQFPFRAVDYAQWTLLPDSRVFFAGGYRRETMSYSDDCFLIAVDGTVELADKLYTRRGNHGIAYTGGRVYCAGGYNGGFLRQVERMDLDANVWRRTTDMIYPRSHFSPTVYLQCLFVAGGASKVVEMMSLDSERFTPLPLSLEHCDSSVILLHTDSELIAIQKDSISQWTMKPKRHFSPTVKKVDLKSWVSKMQPVYVGKKAIFLEDLSNSVYEMDLERKSVREVVFRPNCVTFVLNMKAKQVK